MNTIISRIVAERVSRRYKGREGREGDGGRRGARELLPGSHEE
jgi:hypothetical protein